ncbi:hypothetical protein GUJ93_ZPchr0013g37203 [Zizania palustris]|uniref:VQ domain-containing protein n=1 Tax=Zizania palustris TaxID=103762 RepID=A0A8J5X1Q5_ZIZPA|nr:hypothetical protein GUJ93_ZPchr0013g37203 [Zizania palustris]
MDHGERRNGSGQEAALRAVQRPPGKPWRGGGVAGSAAAMQAPPKVYRVAPRDFRELVQRLTGAGAAAEPQAAAMDAQQAAAPAPAPAFAPPAYSAAPYGQRREDAAAAAEMFDYASWFSMPAAGYDGHHHGSGAFI